MEYTVKETEAGMRLDKVMLSFMETSRSQIQKIVNAGRVTINGKKVKPHHFLKTGDHIVVTHDTPISSPIEEVLRPRIIAETDDYIVFDKPSGLVVHPSAHHPGGTLVDFLLEQYPAIKKVGDDPLRPGIVHRLDKDASGVMVVAKNQESFEQLKLQFKLRTIKKQYLVITYGHIIPAEGTIRFPLGRSKQLFTKIARAEKGKEAVTHYWLIQSVGTCSLVKAQPETGRMHQIRVHFYSYGNPLIGDPIYKSKKIKSISAPRLMLHAAFLGFRDREGVSHEYVSDMPTDFVEIIKKLGGK